MLGRFLEISRPADPVLDSVQFYERLGFQQAPTADLWRHHYGVISDGRFHVGLHADRIHAPTLSWVREDVAGFARELHDDDIAITEAALEDDGLHEIAFDDPDGIGIRVMEARSFSPVGEHARPHPLGWFRELRVRVNDLDASEAFWERLGLVRCGRGRRPSPRASLSCEGLNLMLVQDPGADPWVSVFDHADPDALIGDLALRDIHPDGVEAEDGQTRRFQLHAPDGSTLIVERELI